MEGQQDEEYGFVRRDTDVLKRAMEDDGSRSTGSGGRPAEPEAGEPAASGGKGERQRLPTVAPAEPDRAAGKLPGLFKRMSVSGGSSPQSSATKGDELPQSFQVKYLGSQDARGLWGIKHTRRPVDTLVEAAKNMPSGVVLPLVRLTVTRDGVTRGPLSGGQGSSRMYSIDTISYGVQDLVYTRVFSMIIVRESSNKHNDTGRHPFECHAFVCDSRAAARRLTYALAAAFNEYSKVVRAGSLRKKFAIDLRTPEEIEAELNSALPEADSEA